ncbi:conjugative transfer relaxase/helicase TraI domain-containing protein, partial [Salmonella enterica]
TGLSPEGEARFISGSRKYPSPHVAWPAYDRSGHQQGVWLSEIRRDENGKLQGLSEEGRLLGAESAGLVVLQQSRSGITHQASGQQEALKLAAAHPENGVVLTAEKEHLPDWLLQKLTQGQRADNVEAVSPSQTQDSTVVVLQTPEEKAQQAAEQAIRETLRQDKDRNTVVPERDGKAEQDALVQQGVEQELRRSEREQRREERETERQVAREIQTAKAITAQEHLRELEKEIVLTREKTL